MHKNLPISYDFHGDKPLNLPFEELQPKDIHLYLDLDTKIGKKTCGQACAHCWFVNYEKVFDKAFDFKEGYNILQNLKEQGYTVFPRYVDSFGYDGEFMKLYGPANNREFRQENHKQTETMLNGDAWTSGKPLLQDNYFELLDLAYTSGYRTISITYHGLLNEKGELLDHKSYPIKGVFSGKDCENVIDRIQKYNDERSNQTDFRVNIGITIGKHNHSIEMLSRYIKYFDNLGVATVRFNNFSDHGNQHPHLVLRKDEVIQFYKDIKFIHENINFLFQIGVSEDFGTDGIKVMDFPGHVGWCRAGHQLFTIIPTEEKLISDNSNVQVTKIGDIVACVNIFEPHFGEMHRKVNLTNNSIKYNLIFNSLSIDKFNKSRMQGEYKNGCFAKELRDKNPLQLTPQIIKKLNKKESKQ
jgi:hypothetical protein